MGSRLGVAVLGAIALAAIASGCGSGDDDEQGEVLGTNGGRPVVVSIGDSVASGEGNPAQSGPPWLDRRCHRSETSGQTLAAHQAQTSRPDLGYVNVACSGATIDRGLLGPYRGIEPHLFQRPAPPQVEEVKRIAGQADVAAVLVSIGANDLGFAKIVKFCALVPRCWQQHFNPAFPLAEAGSKAPLLDDYVPARLDRLEEDYHRLDAALEPLLPPERVVIVDYFDPTTAADGTDCTILFGGIKPVESSWARTQVLVPLNARIEAAAQEHGWKVVTGVAEHFRGHGACAGAQRWVRTLGEGPVTGTLHPNEQGHREIAGLIVPVLSQVLGS
jgi:GDSL-like Lipase/Acylhydrolase family